MMWSAETERLRERYQHLYGATQGFNIAAIVTGILWSHEGGWRLWVPLVLAWCTTAWWRWSWRKYRAASQAELDMWVEREKAAFEAAMARLQ